MCKLKFKLVERDVWNRVELRISFEKLQPLLIYYVCEVGQEVGEVLNFKVNDSLKYEVCKMC